MTNSLGWQHSSLTPVNRRLLSTPKLCMFILFIHAATQIRGGRINLSFYITAVIQTCSASHKTHLSVNKSGPDAQNYFNVRV